LHIAKNPKKKTNVGACLKIKKTFQKNIFACLEIQKVLHEFYNQFGEFQSILACISKNKKTHFW
jgi:hypothetical protein